MVNAIGFCTILRVTVRDTTSIQNFGTAEILDQGEGEESYIISKRTVEGHVEMHEQWDDVVVIRSGHGLLRTGRKVTGAILNEERPLEIGMVDRLLVLRKIAFLKGVSLQYQL